MKALSCGDCFSNLAVSSRMQIFIFLKDHGEKTVSEIVEQIVLSQPTISYHLKTMETAGLLSKKRAGKEVYYQVNKTCPSSHKICMLKQMHFTN